MSLLKLCILFCLSLSIAQAATRISSITGGNWSSASTWVSGTIPTTADDVVINGNVTLDGNYTVKKLTINNGKTFDMGTTGYTLSLSNSWSVVLVNNGSFTANNGTIKFTGSGAETSGTITLNNVTIDAANQVKLNTGTTVNGTISVTNGGFITTHPMYGPNAILEINGSYSLSNNYYLWPNATNTTVPPNIIVKSGTLTLGQMALYVVKSFTVNSGATVAASSTCFTLAPEFENFYNYGTLNLGGISVSTGATWNMNANYSVNNFTIRSGGIVNLNNYILTCTYSSSGGLCGSSGDIFKVETGGTFNAGTGTVVLNSTGGGLGISGPIHFNNLVVAGANPVSVTNSTTVISGNLTMGTGSSINGGGTVSGSNLSFDSTATITNAGGTTSNLPVASGVTSTPAPTTTLTGSGGGNIPGVAIINMNNSYTLTSNLNISTGNRKIVTISAGAELIAGAYSITADTVYLFGELNVANTNGLAGVLAGTTKLVIGTGATVNYTATSAQTITPRSNYSHLKLSGGNKTFEAGSYAINGNFTSTASSLDITTNATSFTFNGSSAQSVLGLPYASPSFSGAGNKTLSDTTKVTGVVTISESANLISNGLLTLTSGVSGTASIGALTGSATITGDINYERYIPAGRLWRFIGWPISGNTFANSWQNQIYISGQGTGGGALGTTNSNGFDWTITNETSVFYYNESAAGTMNSKWEAIPNTSTGIDPTKGYRVFIRGARSQGTSLLNGSTYTPQAITLKGTGTPNKGDIAVSLTCSNGCGSGDGWNFVANPYPSAINWSNTSWTSSRGSSISGTVHVYNPISNNYSSWNATGGSVNGGSNIIASGQSFWVKTNGNATLTFKESYKATNTVGGLFGKTAVTLSNNLKIQLGDSSKVFDETVVYMYANASNGIDGDLDALKASITNATISTYTNQTSDKLVFNAIAELSNGATDTILLNTPLANANYNYTLSFLGLTSFTDFTTRMFLIDAYTGGVIALNSNNTYSFSTVKNNAPTYVSNRFKLIIVTGPSSSLPVSLTTFTGKKAEQTTVLNWTTASENMNEQFDVQRSNDGLNFETIGSVKGAGSSNTLIRYAYTDNAPYKGINYYRLKQINTDASFVYSTVISLNFNAAVLPATKATAFPIPATNELTLELHNTTPTQVSIAVVNMFGLIVSTLSVDADMSDYVLPIDLISYKPGIYFLELKNIDGKNQSIKFIKTN